MTITTETVEILETVPVGYREDVRGNLVPEKNIEDIDLARDEFVRESIAKAKALQEAMEDFKRHTLGDFGAFVDMSAERYGVHLGGKRGNVTLTSFDGRMKVQYRIADRLTFDERLMAAKEIIDELLHEWTENASSELKALINRAFDVDKEGNLNTASILSLRKVKIDDPRWLKAMDIISDSVMVAESTSHIRFYKRENQDKPFKHISLDLAKL